MREHLQSGKVFQGELFLEETTLGLDVAEMFNRQNLGTKYCAYSDPLFLLFPDPNPKLNNGGWVQHQTLTTIPPNRDYVQEMKESIKGRVVWDRGTIKSFLKNANNRMIVVYDKVYDISGFFTAQMENTGMSIEINCVQRSLEILKRSKILCGRYLMSLGRREGMLVLNLTRSEHPNLLKNSKKSWIAWTVGCCEGLLTTEMISSALCQITFYWQQQLS
jgi:hypothetical protein